MRVLVTGGAGYIGSHTCVELLQAGIHVVALDNLCNSREESLRRAGEITGQGIGFFEVDLRDRETLDEIFSQGRFEAVIHCAALKAAAESAGRPLAQYGNDLQGTLTLCQAMAEAGVHRLVFSSSAAVYGDPAVRPVHEDAPLAPATLHGRSKYFIEEILRDLQASDPRWNMVLLRYFNPAGAHPSGRIGEEAPGMAGRLMPAIAQVALGRFQRLHVFGSDHPTPDGTGVRDYIHVVDLARAHLAALDKLREAPGVRTYNIGSGRGHSVLEVIAAFERVSGRPIPYDIVARRPGDVACRYADPTRARDELGWHAEYDLERMVADAWRWQSLNPDGY